MYSKTVRYSLRSIMFLAANSDTGHLYKLPELAIQLEINPPILAGVLQKLARNDLIMSRKGRFGGFFMTSSQKNFFVKDVLDKIGEKNINSSYCYLGLKKCEEDEVCPFHGRVSELRNQMSFIYKGETIEWIANKIYSKK